MGAERIITRFPPSPTGYLHIGGARTALFNWLYARQRGGRFILRIEDTDKERSSEQATSAILESMEWLGLDWDEGPYFQSRRTEIYDKMIEHLLLTGHAYHCICSPEELDRKRSEARAKGLKPKYDGTCREKGLGPIGGSVVRLKTPLSGTTFFIDLVKGPIRFDNSELDDLILRRSDGSPTYHMAVVADDINLGITHVIRGDDHVNNTPRQILIYNALSEPLPEYAHVPMILGPDRARLSKRHGAMSVLEYKRMGYLPEALINGLVRLGWSYGDQEKFSREELIQKFSLGSVGKSAGVFNSEKLLDLNAWYIRESSDDKLVEDLMPFLHDLGFKKLDNSKVKKVLTSLKPRSKTLAEMAENAKFFFDEDFPYEKEGEEKYLNEDSIILLEKISSQLKKIQNFSLKELEDAFRAFLEENSIKLKQIAQPLRMALTGKTASPGIFEIMEILGKEDVLKRLEKTISYFIKDKDK